MGTDKDIPPLPVILNEVNESSSCLERWSALTPTRLPCLFLNQRAEVSAFHLGLHEST